MLEQHCFNKVGRVSIRVGNQFRRIFYVYDMTISAESSNYMTRVSEVPVEVQMRGFLKNNTKTVKTYVLLLKKRREFKERAERVANIVII